MTTRVNPVSICFAVTVAAWTTAPLGSRTVPRMLPVICCPATFTYEVQTCNERHQNERQLSQTIYAFPHLSSRIVVDFEMKTSLVSERPVRPEISPTECGRL